LSVVIATFMKNIDLCGFQRCNFQKWGNSKYE